MDCTQKLMRKFFTMLLSMVFVYLSVQENLHCNSYEVNVIRISARMQNSEKGETLNVTGTFFVCAPLKNPERDRNVPVTREDLCNCTVLPLTLHF